MINGVSLFANVGIAEIYLKKCGIDIVVANELIEKRAEFYKNIYPDCEMICGDINDKMNEIIYKAKEKKCKFLMATPPCQRNECGG
ncbi:MAG: DNA cytosine methyltransferase [Clostridia bacterium]|nr:DNA cytosine methyltransferase [Clostridia bacterium]MDD4387335.1 DNA cytosine methyltransferase [Clostridia bacterium]